MHAARTVRKCYIYPYKSRDPHMPRQFASRELHFARSELQFAIVSYSLRVVSIYKRQFASSVLQFVTIPPTSTTGLTELPPSTYP